MNDMKRVVLSLSSTFPLPHCPVLDTSKSALHANPPPLKTEGGD